MNKKKTIALSAGVLCALGTLTGCDRLKPNVEDPAVKNTSSLQKIELIELSKDALDGIEVGTIVNVSKLFEVRGAASFDISTTTPDVIEVNNKKLTFVAKKPGAFNLTVKAGNKEHTSVGKIITSKEAQFRKFAAKTYKDYVALASVNGKEFSVLHGTKDGNPFFAQLKGNIFAYNHNNELIEIDGQPLVDGHTYIGQVENNGHFHNVLIVLDGQDNLVSINEIPGDQYQMAADESLGALELAKLFESVTIDGEEYFLLSKENAAKVAKEALGKNFTDALVDAQVEGLLIKYDADEQSSLTMFGTKDGKSIDKSVSVVISNIGKEVAVKDNIEKYDGEKATSLNDFVASVNSGKEYKFTTESKIVDNKEYAEDEEKRTFSESKYPEIKTTTLVKDEQLFANVEEVKLNASSLEVGEKNTLGLVQTSEEVEGAQKLNLIGNNGVTAEGSTTWSEPTNDTEKLGLNSLWEVKTEEEGSKTSDLTPVDIKELLDSETVKYVFTSKKNIDNGVRYTLNYVNEGKLLIDSILAKDYTGLSTINYGLIDKSSATYTIDVKGDNSATLSIESKIDNDTTYVVKSTLSKELVRMPEKYTLKVISTVAEKEKVAAFENTIKEKLLTEDGSEKDFTLATVAEVNTVNTEYQGLEAIVKALVSDELVTVLNHQLAIEKVISQTTEDEVNDEAIKDTVEIYSKKIRATSNVEEMNALATEADKAIDRVRTRKSVIAEIDKAAEGNESLEGVEAIVEEAKEKLSTCEDDQVETVKNTYVLKISKQIKYVNAVSKVSGELKALHTVSQKEEELRNSISTADSEEQVNEEVNKFETFIQMCTTRLPSINEVKEAAKGHEDVNGVSAVVNSAESAILNAEEANVSNVVESKKLEIKKLVAKEQVINNDFSDIDETIRNDFKTTLENDIEKASTVTEVDNLLDSMTNDKKVIVKQVIEAKLEETAKLKEACSKATLDVNELEVVVNKVTTDKETVSTLEECNTLATELYAEYAKAFNKLKEFKAEDFSKQAKKLPHYGQKDFGRFFSNWKPDAGKKAAHDQKIEELSNKIKEAKTLDELNTSFDNSLRSIRSFIG